MRSQKLMNNIFGINALVIINQLIKYVLLTKSCYNKRPDESYKSL